MLIFPPRGGLAPPIESGNRREVTDKWQPGCALARSLQGERDARSAVDDLEVGDLQERQISRVEQTAPFGLRVGVALRGERNVAPVGQEHAVLLKRTSHHTSCVARQLS